MAKVCIPSIKKGWKDVPHGGVINTPGSALENNTGTWRSFRPIHIPEKCINCLLCWIYCPDASVRAKDGNFDKFDYDHCKGCGVCAENCPTKAIKMIEEAEALEKEK